MTTTDRISGLNGSVGFKAPCRAATTAAITLSGEQTIDGVSIVAGDRVLVKNQASGVDNGIYIASTGAWSRAEDFNGKRDARNGTLVHVTSGTTNDGTFWSVTGTDPITVGTTSITFTAVLSLTDATPYIQTLLDDTDAATARSTLGLGSLATLSAVGAAQITDGTVGTSELADQSVTLAKLSRTGATAGYVLQGNGAGSDPSWTALSTSTSGLTAQIVNSTTGARVALSTSVPFDDSIPQNTEGTEVLTRSITPTNASSTLVITVSLNCVPVAAAEMIAALFQDSTANALAAMSAYGGTGERVNLTFTHVMTAGTTSATTFKVRCGPATAAGTTGELNGDGSGSRRLGGVMSSSITIAEILP